ncbi:MAG: 1,4-dihydroxy-2-naphthoate octaprenyltransferase [Firmicutes bacterium]|nr:1,4-dihydroxy-2-naphthoate octaprenyltransferase [Bacillota bacterium]
MQLQPINKTSYPTHWRVWWNLLRPHTLTASFIPVIIGSTLSLTYTQFRPALFIAMLFACMLLQVATNIFNEYYDYLCGLDTTQSVGIGGTIVREGMSPQLVLRLAQAAVVEAFILGLYLCYSTSWYLLVIGLIAAAIGYLYSGGPYPLSATPLGELVAGMCMGLVIIVTSFYIQTGIVSIISILISIPTSILIGAIMMSNNIRDLEADKLHGRKTLAILLKRKMAVYILQAMFILAYTGIILLILCKATTPWILLCFLSIPFATRAVKGFKKNTSSPKELMPAMVATAQTNTVFGLALAIGLFIQSFF